MLHQTAKHFLGSFTFFKDIQLSVADGVKMIYLMRSVTPPTTPIHLQLPQPQQQNEPPRCQQRPRCTQRRTERAVNHSDTHTLKCPSLLNALGPELALNSNSVATETGPSHRLLLLAIELQLQTSTYWARSDLTRRAACDYKQTRD